MNDCIFCKIVSGKAPCHKIWEDDDHLAFLNIFPNTLGAAVVIPKIHFASDVLAMPDNDLADLTIAAKKVAELLNRSFSDVGRTALVYEGFGIDHAHAKLFPMHGTKMKKWKPILSGDAMMKYFDKYEGYISSHSSGRADDKKLAKLAEKIRKKNE